MSAKPILPAATLVLLRPGAAGPEVFMLQRSSKASFMANAYVFPGGMLESSDGDPRLLARVAVGHERRLRGTHRTHELEQSGILAARRRERIAFDVVLDRACTRSRTWRRSQFRRDTQHVVAADMPLVGARWTGLDLVAGLGGH